LIATSWNNVTEKTIQNCWLKTDILPSTNEDIDDINDINDMDSVDYTEDMQESDFEEMEYILDNLPEAVKVQEYLEQLDSLVPTEEYLSDEQIVNLVQFEMEDEDEDTSDEEIPLVTPKQAINGLETFIKFFEQQDDNSKFNTNELHFFRKYLHITKVITIESKRQCTLDDFLGN